jgi:hypothetical protein
MFLPVGKWELERSKLRWEDNINMNLEEFICKSVNGTVLDPVGVLVLMLVNLRLSLKEKYNRVSNHQIIFSVYSTSRPECLRI